MDDETLEKYWEIPFDHIIYMATSILNDKGYRGMYKVGPTRKQSDRRGGPSYCTSTFTNLHDEDIITINQPYITGSHCGLMFSNGKITTFAKRNILASKEFNIHNTYEIFDWVLGDFIMRGLEEYGAHIERYNIGKQLITESVKASKNKISELVAEVIARGDAIAVGHGMTQEDSHTLLIKALMSEVKYSPAWSQPLGAEMAGDARFLYTAEKPLF
jgi:hypothetical protein